MADKLLKVYTKNHEKHFFVDSDYYNVINGLNWKYDPVGDMIHTYIPSNFTVVKNLRCWQGKSITPGQAVAAVATGERRYTRRISFKLDNNFSYENLRLRPYKSKKNCSDSGEFIDLRTGTKVKPMSSHNNGVYILSRKRNTSFVVFINIEPETIKKAKLKEGEKVSLSYQPKEKVYCIYSVNGYGQKGSTLIKNGSKFRFSISIKEDHLNKNDHLRDKRWYPEDVTVKDRVIYFK